MPLDPSPHEPRHALRDYVEYPARLTGTAFTSIEALVVNISANGCMLHFANPVAIGERVMLDLPIVGSVRGIAIWSSGGRVGIEFDMTLPAASYPDIIAAMTERPGRE